MRRIILALLLVFPLSGYGQTAKYILDGNDDVRSTFFNSTNISVISSAISTNSLLFRDALSLGSAATNPASAFQPASVNLTNLSVNNGANLTNISLTSVVGALGTNGSAAGLTNFPANVLQTNTALASFPGGLLRTNGSAIGLTNFPANVLQTNTALASFPGGLLRTNGSAIGLTNFPTLNQNTTGTASNVTGVVAVVNGGTGGTNTAQFQSALFNSSSLNAQGQRITNLATPVDDSDAATKAYVFNLFNRVAPTVTFTNSVNTVENGSTITNVNLGWSISPTNTPVASQSISPTIGSMDTSLRATNATGSFTTDTTWTLIVNDGTGLLGGIRTNTTSIAFRHYMSWGIASTTSLDNSQIQNLHTNTPAGAGREFRTGKGKSVSISGNGQYIYFAYPASFGAASFIVNNAPNTAWISNTVTYTNSSGNASQFLIYRSTDVQFGTSIPITIN